MSDSSTAVRLDEFMNLKLDIQMHRVGKAAALSTVEQIYEEQSDYDGLSDNIQKRDQNNDFRIQQCGGF